MNVIRADFDNVVSNKILASDSLKCLQKKANKPWVTKGDGFIGYKIYHKLDLKTKPNGFAREWVPTGGVCFGGLWRKKWPHKISFCKSTYSFFHRGGQPTKDNTKYSVSCRDNQIYLYKVVKTPNQRTVRDISGAPHEFLGHFKIEDPKHFRRLCRVLNRLFAINKISRRFKLVDNPLDFQREWKKVVFPNLVGLNNIDYNHSAPIGSMFRRLDLKQVIKQCFGSKGKQLTKICLERLEFTKNTEFFKFGLITKGLMPLDDIQKIIADKKRRIDIEFATRPGEIKIIRKILSNYSSQRVKTLVSKALEKNYIRDTVMSWKKLKEENVEIILPKDAKSFKEIHDYLACEVRKLMVQNRQIPIRGSYEQIIDRPLKNGLSIKWAHDTHTVVDWGIQQNHCLAGYADAARIGQYDVLGVFQENKLKYCISVKRGVLDQFRGRFNCNPEEEDRQIIYDELKKINIITPNNWSLQNRLDED